MNRHKQAQIVYLYSQIIKLNILEQKQQSQQINIQIFQFDIFHSLFTQKLISLFYYQNRYLTIQFSYLQIYINKLTQFYQPPQRQNRLNNNRQVQKMNKKLQQCPSCQNLQKRIKVLQADYDFQIKKLNQDKSTQKALYELNTNKQIKKLTQKCQKQKQERAKQNQNWMKKYDELIQRQKLQMNQYKLSKDKQVEDYKSKKDSQVKQFMVDKVSKLQKSIQTLKNQKQQTQKQIKLKSQKQVQQLKFQQQQKIQKLLSKHEEQLKKKCGQYEAVILGINSQKSVQQNLHKKTKQQSKNTQSKLLQQIYVLKKNIIDHQDKIGQLRTQIKQKSEQIQNLKVNLSQNQQKYQLHYFNLSKQYDDKYVVYKKQMQEKIQKLFKKQLQNCTKYEKALEKIQQHRDMENKMYKANLQDIKSCVEQRPSRLQDVEEIIKLKERLIRKENQFQTIFEQLKWYKLELENKEQTYNKIFGPDSKNNQNIYIRRKDLKAKRAGKSVTSVRQILSNVNTNSTGNNLAPLVGNLQKKFMPPKLAKIL